MRSPFSAKIYLYLTGFLLLITPSAFHAQDLKAEDIIARHLDAIGTKQKREEVKTRVAAGASTFESKLPAKQANGRAIIVSNANNLFFLSSFSSQDYPFEKIGYFSEKVELPFTVNGNSMRSPLGAFIIDHSKMLTEGIFGGCLSTLWGMQSPKGKLSTAGKKKIDGRDTYVLNYFPRTMEGDFYIKIYFDAQTFQHRRTEYGFTTTPALNPMGTMGRQATVKTTVIENFGNYKEVEGLTLPHSYKINYLKDGDPALEFNWEIAVSQYVLNKTLDPGFFTFEEK